ncbi:ubiquitin-like domain-containing protein, partial [Haematococcus lacustris]
MTADVVAQLQQISAQQSKIRDLKARLKGYEELLAKQDAALSELRSVVKLPAAYRGLLVECVRRRAWHELYSAQVCCPALGFAAALH